MLIGMEYTSGGEELAYAVSLSGGKMAIGAAKRGDFAVIKFPLAS